MKNKVRDTIKYNKIKTYFSDKKEVDFAYLFGSYANDKMTKFSDIDIAFYISHSFSNEERFKLRLKMITDLVGLIKMNDIDVVPLNDAPLHLKFKIIYYGEVLVQKDQKKRIDFEARTNLAYLDFKYYQDRYFKNLSKRIKEGRFGSR